MSYISSYAIIYILLGVLLSALAAPTPVIEVQKLHSAPFNSTLKDSPSGLVQLDLCDCERADGYPNGLGCTKEGFFISSFENQGTWVRQPLNKFINFYCLYFECT